MNSTTTNPGARIIPTMRYVDAVAAIEWLCTAFGFEKHLVVPDGEGGIAHAQLVLADGMIMLGSVRNDDLGVLQQPPSMLGRVGSQSAYIVVEDADAHYARAVAAGAEVLLDITDQDYGGRGYSCRDPEDHVWSFGTYDPWGAQ